jgi:hypothetical protein
MDLRPLFSFGTATFQPSISAPPWIPESETIGNTRWTALGDPGPALESRFRRVRVPLRILEEEWLSFLALIEFGQTGNALTWQPDPDLEEEFEVFLDDPMAGKDWTAHRSAEFPRVLEVTITLRGSGTSVPWLPYFGEV